MPATEDLSLLSEISPESQEAAGEAVLAAREDQPGLHEPFWTMEDHLRAMTARVKHMGILGKELPLAGIAAFKALWPEKKVPKKLSTLCEWLLATTPQLVEWHDSAGRRG